MALNWLQSKTVRELMHRWTEALISKGLTPFFLLGFPVDAEHGFPEFFTIPHIDLRNLLPRTLERIAADLRSGDFKLDKNEAGQDGQADNPKP